MKPSRFPDWIDHLWAKSPDKGQGGQAESLAQHTWSVLECLAEFIHLRPLLPNQLNRPDLWHILFWGTFFHDFGKVIPAFQGVLRGDPNAKAIWQKHRHEVLSLAFLEWVTDSFDEHQLDWVRAAIVSHHRDPDEIIRLYPHPEPDDDNPLQNDIFNTIADNDLSGLWRWVNDCSHDWIESLKLSTLGVNPINICQHSKAICVIKNKAAQSVYSQLASYRKFIRSLSRDDFVAIVPLITLRGYLINSDHGASAHAGVLPKAHITRNELLATWNIGEASLFDHQIKAASTYGSAILIAPTGSGKTEAALLWAASQKYAGYDPPRLFYTLPYQASMNAMFLRLQEIFGPDKVGLQHSRGLLALYHQLMDRDYSPHQAAYTARQMRNLADLNHPPVRVFSPYQILKWMYRLKGYEAQLSDYHNALFIFDEIHAYEVKRLALILRTIRYLRENYHASFIVMSATFPSIITDWLRDALGDPVKITAGPKLYQQFQRHKLNIIEGDLLEPLALDRIANHVKSGQSTLVVCNIVARAQTVFLELKSRLHNCNIPVILLHGRFNMQDRSHKEAFIRQKVATKLNNQQPILLVATQVVEVSLDIDLNTIYTDPAPLEALVQRFGRVNRARRMGELASVNVFSQPNDGQNIYDPILIERALGILFRENQKPIDELSIGNWLDEIYSGEVEQKWKDDFEKAGSEFEAACVRSLRPFATDAELENEFYKAFDSIEVLPENLYNSFFQLKDEQPIIANELLVPISWRRYKGLESKGLILPRDQFLPPVIRTDYSSELGLTFEPRLRSDEFD